MKNQLSQIQNFPKLNLNVNLKYIFIIYLKYKLNVKYFFERFQIFNIDSNVFHFLVFYFWQN
jgi:hypothetical protein